MYLLDFSQVIFAGQCYTKLNHWVLHRGWPKMDFTISAVKWNSQKINFLFLPKNKQKRSTIFSRKWKKANIFHTELSGTAWLMQSAVIYLCRLITNLYTCEEKQQANVSPSASSWIAMSTCHGPDRQCQVQSGWTRGLQLTKLRGPPCISWVKALTVFGYFTAIFLRKNKINWKRASSRP